MEKYGTAREVTDDSVIGSCAFHPG